MKRHKMSRSSSKRQFSSTAARTHRKNIQSTIMRGGYRL